MTSSDTKPVITRFAPSPTGFLHIGGARTALFNWLFAFANGGKMLLRIEDTDRERSSDAAIDAIIDGMKWLGLDWSGEAISQFDRVERHAEVAKALLVKGLAYRCYASPEELAEMREKARAEKRPPRYDGRWRDRPASEAPDGVAPVIRIKSPEDGETVIEDLVQGTVTFPNKDLDDFVILRADGTPTYMLAVVVDDYDMGVTNVIRGDDHLTNAARQKIIFDAMSWDFPTMAHIPLIHGSDGAKLSKRHGALGVEAYREMGYLPEALRNYLLRLGWAHGDQEYFTLEELETLFSLKGVGKSPSRFDFTKLENMCGHYIRNMDDKPLLDAFLAFLPHSEDGRAFAEHVDDAVEAQLLLAMPGLKERAKSLVELLTGAQFITAKRPLPLDDKAAGILDKDDGRGRSILTEIAPVLAECANWDMQTVEDTVRKFTADKELKLGQVAQPLRASLTGRGVSPGVFDVLYVLGKDESLARIADQAA
ncbi:MAG: glutamate--tRNA ligase [Pseudomonadota bacterium]